MNLHPRIHPRSRRLFSALLAALALMWSPLPGLAQACIAWDSFGIERDCTFTESLGKCMWEAANSRDECLDRVTGPLTWGRCHLAFGIDNTACIIGSPIQIFVFHFK